MTGPQTSMGDARAYAATPMPGRHPALPSVTRACRAGNLRLSPEKALPPGAARQRPWDTALPGRGLHRGSGGTAGGTRPTLGRVFKF